MSPKSLAADLPDRKEWLTSDNDDGSISTVSKRVQRELIVPLTDEEKARLAEDICSTYAEEIKLEAEKKDWLAGWKARKEKNNAVRANKIGAVSTGKEPRIVDCDEVFDHVSGTHYFFHGTLQHQVRPMRDAEYLIGQETLFDFESWAEELVQNVSEIRPDAVLVASSDDSGTKVSKRVKKLKLTPIASERDRDIHQVIREETKAKTKVDVSEF